MKKTVFVISLIVVLAVGFIALNGGFALHTYDDFAKCLYEKDVKMYGAFWCPHCQNQKSMFGASFEFVNYIECSLPDGNGQTEVCINEKIEGYPTWDFNGERVSGELSLEELSRRSGCSLPE